MKKTNDVEEGIPTDAQALHMMLESIDVKDVPLSAIEGWTEKEIDQVIVWAGAIILAASDNHVSVPPVPEALKNYGGKP